MAQPQTLVRNVLLRAMLLDCSGILVPALERIELRKGDPMMEAGETCRWAVFPETGIVSIVDRSASGRQIEVGIVGVDGMAGLPIVLGTDSTPYRAFVQVDGVGHRVRADALRDVLGQYPGVKAMLLRYVQAFLVQVAETAISNGSHTIEERLARWLLLVHDRIGGDEVPLTHEFLAIMLGVRRTGVTLAVHALESAGVIRARRGVIGILDRAKLVLAAVDSYGVSDAEYKRLMGVSPGDAASNAVQI